MLRRRSRPYLFSNTVAPAIMGAAIKAFEMLSATIDVEIAQRTPRTSGRP